MESSLVNVRVWKSSLTFSTSHLHISKFFVVFKTNLSVSSIIKLEMVLLWEKKFLLPQSWVRGHYTTYQIYPFLLCIQLMSFWFQGSWTLNLTVFPRLFCYLLIEVIHNPFTKRKITQTCMCEDRMRTGLEVTLC